MPASLSAARAFTTDSLGKSTNTRRTQFHSCGLMVFISGDAVALRPAALRLRVRAAFCPAALCLRVSAALRPAARSLRVRAALRATWLRGALVGLFIADSLRASAYAPLRRTWESL